MQLVPTVVFNAAATGTQYTENVRASNLQTVGFIVKHPGSTTTAYTVQVSNATDDEVRLGLDDWADYTPISIPSKSAAETFYVEYTLCAFALVRLKMVTSSGTGTIKVNGAGKGGG